jgi:hypothetical protein
MALDTTSEFALDHYTNLLLDTNGDSYTAGFLLSQLKAVVEMLPKSKRAAAIASFAHVVASNVKVTVKNLMSGEAVEIPLNDVGGPCDPSTEKYWTM